MSQAPVYLDNQATSPLDPRVLQKMMPYLTSEYANCHSQHLQGRECALAVETARANVAKMVGAQPNEIIFTSGATESNNLAVKGVARYQGEKKPHVITSKIEHKCVLESVRSLEAEGFQTHFIGVDRDGRLKMDELEDCLKTHDGKVSLVSVMGANNEVGTVQDIRRIGQLAHEHGALYHSDCAQLVGKHPVDVRKDNIDLMSISGHKIYGPKGVGAIFINKKNRVRLVPLLSGGGQEANIRSGTLPVFLCVGLGEAANIINHEMDKDIAHYKALANIALDAVKDVPKVVLNGSREHRIPNNLNLSFLGVEGESLMLAIDGKVAVSTGSACTSQSLEPSHVLHAMGIPAENAHTAVRIGFGRFTTEDEVRRGMDEIKKEVARLRSISVLWDE